MLLRYIKVRRTTFAVGALEIQVVVGAPEMQTGVLTVQVVVYTLDIH